MEILNFETAFRVSIGGVKVCHEWSPVTNEKI